MNPLSKKHISKCQKNRNKNSTCTSWHVMFVHKFLEEKNIFYVLYKKRQIYVWTYHYSWDIFLSFLLMPHKIFFVVKNLCANIEYPDWHAKFIFRIFWHLKFVFYAFFIIGSYTPESQNTSSSKDITNFKEKKIRYLNIHAEDKLTCSAGTSQ
jgi:hypothetical protein